MQNPKSLPIVSFFFLSKLIAAAATAPVPWFVVAVCRVVEENPRRDRLDSRESFRGFGEQAFDYMRELFTTNADVERVKMKFDGLTRRFVVKNVGNRRNLHKQVRGIESRT